MVTVQDQPPCVGIDCLILVVTAAPDVSASNNEIEGSESLFAQNKAIILAKPSYAVPTLSSTYTTVSLTLLSLVEDTRAALHNLEIEAEKCVHYIHQHNRVFTHLV
jgi:hypothetical protein